MEQIKLRSKNFTHYLRKLEAVSGEESKVYRLIPGIVIFRRGRLEDGRYYVFPSGGPRIVEGESIRGCPQDWIVKTIYDKDDFGYVVEFE